MSHTRASDDPLCALILAHRRLGLAAAGATDHGVADSAPNSSRELLFDLSEVALDAAARLAAQGRSEGVPVRLALRRPLEGPRAGVGDRGEGMLRAVCELLDEDLAHTALLAAVLDCEVCSRMAGHDHEGFRPFVEPIRRRLPAPTTGSGALRPPVPA